jgi:hypothetical protein
MGRNWMIFERKLQNHPCFQDNHQKIYITIFFQAVKVSQKKKESHIPLFSAREKRK